MKILFTFFKIQDFGGIINYSEILARGFKELGHSVDSVLLNNKGITGTPKTRNRSGESSWEYGPGLNLWMNQRNGWEGMNRLNYTEDVKEGEDWAEGYDLVLYIIPVPSCSKPNKHDDQWSKLFRNCLSTQLVVIHDANMTKLYPHIYHICSYIQGAICVHDAAYNSCSVLPVPSMFIPNAHEWDEFEYIKPIIDRQDAILSLQTFKRLKRVDDLVRAIPYIDEFTDKIICGGGIEYCYMTSKDKCRPEYFNESGERIWDLALKHGMEFKGYIDTKYRDQLLSDVKLLVDPSWSKGYHKQGAHFNRVIVEAIAKGCIPVSTDLTLGGSVYFKPGENYIEIPYTTPPEQYAEILNKAISNEELLIKIQTNNLKLMNQFEKCFIANKILEFATDTTAGRIGIPTEKFISDANRKLEHFEDW